VGAIPVHAAIRAGGQTGHTRPDDDDGFFSHTVKLSSRPNERVTTPSLRQSGERAGVRGFDLLTIVPPCFVRQFSNALPARRQGGCLL
jgi:hypothetical protein